MISKGRRFPGRLCISYAASAEYLRPETRNDVARILQLLPVVSGLTTTGRM